MRNSKSSPEKSLSKSEQHLSQIGKIKRLLFSDSTFQTFLTIFLKIHQKNSQFYIFKIRNLSVKINMRHFR